MSTELKPPPRSKTRKREEVPPQRLHIEAPGQDAMYGKDNAMVVMLCGLVVTFDEHAHVIPAGEDFYAFSAGHKATCPACLEAWMQLA
jgi:hypothetical protein